MGSLVEIVESVEHSPWDQNTDGDPCYYTELIGREYALVEG
jgi:hypothetical protein